MLPVGFLYIAIALRLIGGFAYLRATIRGVAKPNPVSWLIWGLTPMITFLAQLQAGVGAEAFVTLAFATMTMLVFVAAMRKNPTSWKLEGLNLVCITIALCGLLAWILTDDPVFAISLLITADLASTLPTLVKSLRSPATEYPTSYLLSAISMAITLLVITDWRFVAVAYPVYALTTNLLIFMLTKRSKPKRRHSKHRRA